MFEDLMLFMSFQETLKDLTRCTFYASEVMFELPKLFFLLTDLLSYVSLLFVFFRHLIHYIFDLSFCDFSVLALKVNLLLKLLIFKLCECQFIAQLCVLNVLRTFLSHCIVFKHLCFDILHIFLLFIQYSVLLL